MIEIARRLSGAGPRAARLHTVLEVRVLSGSAFVLRFTRNAFQFRPGQWLNLGLPGSREQREYSIYSSPADDFLEVLVKEIPDGALSPALRKRKPGDLVEVDGPHGAFTLVEGPRDPPRFLFCATGTGVSPFHCFARSVPGLDYTLLHGVRTATELYERETFASERFVACVSGGARDVPGVATFGGRLTSWLRANPVEQTRYCYLCGNSDMIYETYMILKELRIPRSRIFAEVYFSLCGFASRPVFRYFHLIMKKTLLILTLACGMLAPTLAAAEVAAGHTGVPKYFGIEAGYGYLVSAEGLAPAAGSGLLAGLYYGYGIGETSWGRTILSLALGYSWFPEADGLQGLHAVIYGLEYAHTFFPESPVQLVVSYGLLFNLVLLEGRTGYAFGHDTRLSFGPSFPLGKAGEIIVTAGYNFVTFPYFEVASTRITYPSLSVRYQIAL